LFALGQFRERRYKDMQKVEEILKAKGSQVWAIGPEATAYEALEIMADKNVGALMVVKDGRLVGVFSERDYARKVILKGKSSKDTPVSDLMSRELVFASSTSTVSECMALMTAKKARHLPIMEDGKLRGVISIGDVVGEIIADQDFTIQEMQKYILAGH
jgi:CBS domain-containing protein